MLYRPGPPTTRAGLSLLEVLVSLAIFLLALVALGEIVSFASDRALDVQQRSEALQICQSRLAEVQAGSIPLQSQDLTPCDEDDQYQWAVDIEAGAAAGLYTGTVRVTRERANRSQLEVALSQMVIDPTTLGSTQDMPGTQSATDVSSSSSSSSTGSTTSGTTGSTTTGGK